MRPNPLKHMSLIIPIFVILAVTLLGQFLFLPDAKAADKVMFRLHWKCSAMHTPFILAMDKGFYKEEGIDITIKEGAGSTATLKLIGAGRETFGFAGTNVTVKGVARGVPVIQVMVVEKSKRQGILFPAAKGIKTPQDLIGKTIAGSGSGTSDIFEAFLAVNNLTLKQVRYLAAGRARLEAVATGKADGTLGLGMDDIVRLQKMGVEAPQILLFGDWGIPDVGDGIITHLDTYKKNPDLIRRFVKASLRGINHAFMDLEETADIAVKHFPMAKKDIILTQLRSLRWLFPPPLGWQDPKVVEAMQDIVARFAGLPQAKDMPLNKFFTNEFLPTL